jgi:hypothetical protein
MDEKYRLVFRGEILEGHHKAVVKRRLQEALQLDEPRMEKLFSGSPIVVKRDADQTTAARYQTIYKKAGGLLRVVAEQPVAADPESTPAEHTGGGPTVMNQSITAADTEQPFSVDGDYVPPPDTPANPIQAPDFGLAEVGADLVEAVEAPPVIVPEPQFDLAEVGADILEERPSEAPVKLGPLNFEVAEVGSVLGLPRSDDPVVVPDISHLKLVER